VRCAEQAFEAALDVRRAGRKVREIGRAVERVVRAEGSP
jgi:methionine aminopeptidase